MEKLFKNILQMSQTKLHNFLVDELHEKGYKNIKENKNGYIYAEGNIPFMLVAHLDTVHPTQPKNIFFDKEQQVIWSPEGIGGDDRCGVYAILKILEEYRPHVLFLHDEEVGGVGARIAVKELVPPDVNFLIEFDRNGSVDAVFYDCGNEEFQDHIISFGFVLDYGSFSDISVLSPEWDIASVNLSIGYYNEHTTREFIRLDELESTVEKTKNILENSDPDKFYDNQTIYYKYNFGSYFSKYGSREIIDMSEIDGVEELTDEDVERIFGFAVNDEIDDEDLSDK